MKVNAEPTKFKEYVRELRIFRFDVTKITRTNYVKTEMSRTKSVLLPKYYPMAFYDTSKYMEDQSYHILKNVFKGLNLTITETWRTNIVIS